MIFPIVPTSFPSKVTIAPPAAPGLLVMQSTKMQSPLYATSLLVSFASIVEFRETIPNVADNASVRSATLNALLYALVAARMRDVIGPGSISMILIGVSAISSRRVSV